MLMNVSMENCVPYSSKKHLTGDRFVVTDCYDVFNPNRTSKTNTNKTSIA